MICICDIASINEEFWYKVLFVLLEGNGLALGVSVVVSMLFTSLVKVWGPSHLKHYAGFFRMGLCIVLLSSCRSSFHMVQPSGASLVKVKTGYIPSRSRKHPGRCFFSPFRLSLRFQLFWLFFLFLLFYCLS